MCPPYNSFKTDSTMYNVHHEFQPILNPSHYINILFPCPLAFPDTEGVHFFSCILLKAGTKTGGWVKNEISDILLNLSTKPPFEDSGNGRSLCFKQYANSRFLGQSYKSDNVLNPDLFPSWDILDLEST